MATLTETAYYSRQLVKYGSVGLVVFLVLRAGLLFGIAYWKKLHPPPPPPPTVAFGQLPKIVFPESLQPPLTYTLETITGDTPDLGDRATVYFMPIRTANLLALERMQSISGVFGFASEPKQLSGTRYRWFSDDPLPATLTADIISGSFTLEADWSSDPKLLEGGQLPTDLEAVDEAKGVLRGAGILSEDLVSGTSNVTFLKADVTDLVKAVSLSEADFIRVDLFRAPIEELAVFTPNPDRGVVSMIFSGNRTPEKRVVQLNYNYFPVDYEQSATYPIKTSNEAWSELQAEHGYVARVNPKVTSVVVRRISLSYFDSAIPQNYLQPIYVFEGDDNFVGYVPAITSTWIESEEEL